MATESAKPPLNVRELTPERLNLLAKLRLPYRHLASISTPTGCVVVAFRTDSIDLSRLFAGNWSQAETDRRPDATLQVFARPARDYGLEETWDEARWWSSSSNTMVLFGCDSYHLVKVCTRGICSAMSAGDLVFLHGCVLSVQYKNSSHGVAIMGSSGAGKTTLVAELSERPGYSVHVLNDDWGAVSVQSGAAVNTGEINLHMKTRSILALRPDFFACVAPNAYMYDTSEADPSSRLLVAPECVYDVRWTRRRIVIENIAVIVREAPGWEPPRQLSQVLRFLGHGGYDDYFRRSEPFFNGSLILRTDADWTREVTRYETLMNRVSLSWINNCGTVDELAEAFVRAVIS